MRSQYPEDKLHTPAMVSTYTSHIFLNNESQSHKTCSNVKRLMTLEKNSSFICLSNGGMCQSLVLPVDFRA